MGQLNHIALFVLGAPGAGKTSLVRSLLGMPARTPELIAKPKWTVARVPEPGPLFQIAAVGHYTGATFDGGDTVAYNGAAAALDYWEQKLLPLCRVSIFDGDRFSTDNSLNRVMGTDGVLVAALLLLAEDEVLEERRAARGSKQNPSWMKGRATKAERFYLKIHLRKTLRQRAGFSPEEQAKLVHLWLRKLGG